MAWITSFWASSSVWEGVEYAAEVLVVICALLEFLADFELILKGDEKKARRKRVEKRAAIGLVLGLAAELGALVRTNSLFTDTITSAYNEASDANKGAKDASEKAARAQDRADKAYRDLAALEATIHSQRRLSKHQKKVLCSALTPPLTNNTVVTYLVYDSEVASYSKDFVAAINECAGKRVLLGLGIEAYEAEPGLWISVGLNVWSAGPSVAERKSFLESLRKKLDDSGVKVTGTNFEGSGITIRIGSRFVLPK